MLQPTVTPTLDVSVPSGLTRYDEVVVFDDVHDHTGQPRDDKDDENHDQHLHNLPQKIQSELRNVEVTRGPGSERRGRADTSRHLTREKEFCDVTASCFSRCACRLYIN